MIIITVKLLESQIIKLIDNIANITKELKRLNNHKENTNNDLSNIINNAFINKDNKSILLIKDNNNINNI